MRSRFSLINAGLYPETLPPCFVSQDAKRAFHGLVGDLDTTRFHEHKSEYIRYNGTKHDASRRFFATPNIISYFHIASFIWKNWRQFQKNFSLSDYSIGAPELMDEGAERAVKVPSLSELSQRASENLRYAPFMLRADIAQCFPSIYTHSIAWAAHGIGPSKSDTRKDSVDNIFNALDFFVRNGQRGNTRGVIIGPDAHRLIAEFVLCRIDEDLKTAVGDVIVGAVRHVDDYYIGLSTEYQAQSVLSHLREVLATYELNLNDHKTTIFSSLEPINDLWAQRLRDHIRFPMFGLTHARLERAISEAVETARILHSDSPIKILMRALDEAKIYKSQEWDYVERYAQRIVQKHPHAIDYVCLLVAKRRAIGRAVDVEGWTTVAEIIIHRGLALNHHHEVLWMVWLLLICDIKPSAEMVEALARSPNGHIRALLAQAHVEGRLERKPKLSLGSGLSSTDANWLVNLVARSCGFSKAAFSGSYAQEFDHLAQRGIRLIDFEGHTAHIAHQEQPAISRIRYGYDDEREDEENDPFGESLDEDELDEDDFPAF